MKLQKSKICFDEKTASPLLLEEEVSPTVSCMKNPIRLLLVDDHPVVRKGLRSCLENKKNLQIVGEAGDGQQALAKARELKPDLILMDVDMPQMNGLTVSDILRKEMPQIKILFLSIHGDSENVMRILQSGARGYVLKDASPEELMSALETVNSGETYFSPDVARVALKQLVSTNGTGTGLNQNQLTLRERDVLVNIAEGLSNKEIASKLGVGVRTIETHRERIMRKLDIHSVAGLTRFAISKGMVSIGEKTTR
jgi:two-component system nitrate/nitrite response regulator NarL